MQTTSAYSVRRDGRGRARTGPSLSLVVTVSVVLALSLAAQFAFGTDIRREFAPEVIAVISGLAAAAGVAMVAGSPRGLKVTSPMAVLIPLALGALAFVGAPAIVMFHRYSDAPPGSEVLFLTTAAWGAIIALLAVNSWRLLPLSLASVVIGLAGVIGIVANWERPSSFSLFIRYQGEEAWMLVAGVAFGLLWWWLARARDHDDSTRAAVAAAVGALLGAVLLAFGRGVGLQDLAQAASSVGLWMYALSTAAVAAAAVTLVRAAGASAVAGVFFLPAAALTAITLIEQATTPMGPQPILLGPAMAGAITAVAACVLLWTGDGDSDAPPRSRWPLLVSLAAVAAGIAGLALPALEAHVTGRMTSGQQLDLTYVLRGYEVMGPWAVFGLALAVLALVLSRSKVRPIHVGALLAAGLAWPFVWATPLHTLTRFVPSEVQVDFGSEYAAITFSKLAIPATLLSLAGAGVGLALLSSAQRAQSATRQTTRGDVS